MFHLVAVHLVISYRMKGWKKMLKISWTDEISITGIWGKETASSFNTKKKTID